MIDGLIAGKRSEAAILGSDGVLGGLTRRLIERVLAEELSAHLGYPAGQARVGGAGNSRNGATPKTVLTGNGPVQIQTPRDRQGRFEPELVRKGQRRLAGLDEKIIALYAGGMTTREIETYIGDTYGPGVSRETVNRVTAGVLEDAKAWQTRPLETVCPILYLDALIIKIRDGNAVRNFACYLAIGVNLDGDRDVLGIWFQKTEGAKFWLQVLTELKTRGVSDVLVCCVDGLTGFPDAIEAVFPQTWVQTCLVHAVRAALRFVPYKDKRAVAGDLKKIYTAADRDGAWDQLEAFAETWDAKYPMISASWIENWNGSSPSWRSRPSCAAPSTPPTPSRRSTDRSARSSRPEAASRRGLRPRAALPRDHPRPTQVAPQLQLELGPDRVPHPLRGPHPRHRNLTVTP